MSRKDASDKEALLEAPREEHDDSPGSGQNQVAAAPPAAVVNQQTGDLADVIIIGAGLSGLTCADELLSKNPALSILILEGADRVGGRTKTIDVELSNSGKKVKIDAGGMWLGPTHKHMLANCERFGIETIPQYYFEGKHVLARGDASSRKAYKGEIPPYSIPALLELQFSVLNKVGAMSKKVPLEQPWMCPSAKEWDAFSVQSYMDKTLWTTAAKEAADLICWALLGAQASQVSWLFFLWLVHACEGVKMLTDATGGAQDRTMKGGSQQVSERLREAAEAKGARVLFNAWVKKVDAQSSSTGHIVEITCTDGQVYKSKVLVSAGLASKFLRDCMFSQRLPGDIQRFANTSFRGAYAKAVVIYETAWWRTAGFSGFVTNTRPSLEACGCFGYDYGIGNSMVIFVAGDISAEVGSLSEDKRKASVLASLELFFPEHKCDVARFVSYHDEFWQYDNFAQGGPMTVYPPGFFRKYSTAKLLRKPYTIGTSASPILYFAGTDVSTNWTGYMEGACVRGKEVAEQVGKHWQDRIAKTDSSSVDVADDATWMPMENLV